MMLRELAGERARMCAADGDGEQSEPESRLSRRLVITFDP
jgi:hypothetical protein